MNLFCKVYKVFFVWRYPDYIKKIYNDYVLPEIIRNKGVQLGNNISFSGMPIISIAPGSVIKIGSNAVLCSQSERTALGVNHPIVLRTMRKGARLEIGRRVRMSGVSICSAQVVAIGNDVMMGANVIVTDTDFHALAPDVRKTNSDLVMSKHEDVIIEDDVFIGANSIILKGVHIGRGAFIGAGAIVTRDVRPLTIVAGNPAQEIGTVLPLRPKDE